jgi:hypothetical protein
MSSIWGKWQVRISAVSAELNKGDQNSPAAFSPHSLSSRHLRRLHLRVR